MPHDLILKAVDEASAAQRQAVAAVGAPAESHAVHRARIVDVDGVPVCGCPVGDLLFGGVLAQQVIDLRLHILFGGLHIRPGNGDGRIVLGQGDIIQCLDALPEAVLIQPVAVCKILIIVICRTAVGRDCLAGRGRGCGGLGAALPPSISAPAQSRQAAFFINRFNWNPPVARLPPGFALFFILQAVSIIKGKNEKEKNFSKFPQIRVCLTFCPSGMENPVLR